MKRLHKILTGAGLLAAIVFGTAGLTSHHGVRLDGGPVKQAEVRKDINYQPAAQAQPQSDKVMQAVSRPDGSPVAATPACGNACPDKVLVALQRGADKRFVLPVQPRVFAKSSTDTIPGVVRLALLSDDNIPGVPRLALLTPTGAGGITNTPGVPFLG